MVYSLWSKLDMQVRIEICKKLILFIKSIYQKNVPSKKMHASLIIHSSNFPGIVYIKFAKASEAMMAMEEMHGKYLDNFPSKALNVLLSQDGNRNFKSNEPFTARLYVKIEKQMNRYDLKNMFKVFSHLKKKSL